MLDFIASRADIIIAATQAALTLDMMSVVWHQFRAKASTVPLLSSVPTSIGLVVLALVFFSTGLYLATGTLIVGSAMWAVVAAQRVVYNRRDGSTIPAPDANPVLRIDHSRVSSSSPVDIRYEGDECDCVHYAWAGWCRCDPSPAGGSQGQGIGVGLAGDSQSSAPPIEEISSVIQHPSTTIPDGDGNSAKLEEA